MFIIFLMLINPFIAAIISLFGVMYSNSKQKIYLLVIIIFIASICFNVVPHSNKLVDLYRHYDLMDNIGQYSLPELFTNKVITTNVIYDSPLSFLTMYLIAITQKFGFLPFLSILITYSLFFNIILDFSKQNHISKNVVTFAYLFVISIYPFLAILSGIRNNIAIALFCHATFKILICNKNNSKYYFMLFGSALIHNSLIIPIALFILNKCNKKKIRFGIRTICLIWAIFIPFLKKVFIMINNNYFKSLSNKLGTLINTMNAEGVQWYYLVISIIIFGFFLWFYKVNYKEEYFKYKEYSNLVQLVLLFTIGSIFNTTLLTRMFYLLTILIIPLLMQFMKKINNQKMIVLYLVFIVMYISSYKQIAVLSEVDFELTIIDILTNTIFSYFS